MLLVLAADPPRAPRPRSGRARRATSRRSASGPCVGGAYLTRPEGLLYAPVAMAVLARPDRRAGRAGTAAAGCSRSGAIGLGLLVFVVPYASYLHSNTGSWELTAKTNDASIEAWQAVADHDREARDAVIYELADDGVSFAAGRVQPHRARPRRPCGLPATSSRPTCGSSSNEVAAPVEREHVELGLGAAAASRRALLAVWGAWRLRRRPSVWLLLTALLAPDRDRPGVLRPGPLPDPGDRVRAASSPGWRSPSCAASASRIAIGGGRGAARAGRCSRPPTAATGSSTGASPWSTGSWASGCTRTRRATPA